VSRLTCLRIDYVFLKTNCSRIELECETAQLAREDDALQLLVPFGLKVLNKNDLIMLILNGAKRS